MRNKAVFVDRDGTINIDVHYLSNLEQFEMYPGVGAGIRSLKDAGYMILVITNQSGVGRGYFSEEQLGMIHDRMRSEFLQHGVVLDGIYYCPHHPDANCNCRKPKTLMFEQAIRDLQIDVTSSFMLGDKILDIEAGKKAGVRTILIPEPHMREDCLARKSLWSCEPDFIADDFTDAVRWILTK